MIRIENGQFTINGERRPYLIQSWFKFMSYLREPWVDTEKARLSLQRASDIGMDGIRIMDEHHDWLGAPFLEHGAPLSRPWDLHQPTNSSFSMTEAHRDSYRRLVELLGEYGMIAELVVNATIKSSPGPLKGDSGRTVRYWERMQRVVLQFIRTLDGKENIVFENCNEFDQHLRPGVYDFLRSNNDEVDLVPRMAERAGRDCPGRPYGISQGGGWDTNKYEVPPYTHVNIHSPRQGNWWDVVQELRMAKIKNPGVPICLNENMHGMSGDQWDYWIASGHHPKPDKLANQSVNASDENVALMLAQYTEARHQGVSYCLHNANGIFSDPEAPYDKFEIAFGGGATPSPPTKLMFNAHIEACYQKVFKRAPDPDGLHGYNELLVDGTIQPTDLINILYRSEEYKNNKKLW